MEAADKLRIVFMATPAFALPSLQALSKGEDEMVAVVTQPDKPRGRGRKRSPSPVKSWAMAEGIPVLEPKSLKGTGFYEILNQLKPDLIVALAYGKFLPKAILELPRLGCINLHASILPKYRGPAPIQWALLSGEKEIGVTAHYMVEAMDAGPILLQRAIPVGADDTLGTIENKLSGLSAELLMATVNGLKSGGLKATPQAEDKATFAPLLKKGDGKIDWERNAVEIERRIRALNPWPGTFTWYEGKSLKLLAARAIDQVPGGPPGEVMEVSREGWKVACGSGTLLVLEVQLENGKRMAAYNFALGHMVKTGLLLGDLA